MATREQNKPPVEGAVETLYDEHSGLHDLFTRIKQATDVPHLQPLLQELHPRLMQHFGHEEFPGGLYETMGACIPAFRDTLRGLVDDHFHFLSTSHGLIRRVDHKEVTAPEQAAALVRSAHELIDALLAHETKEHQLARQCSDTKP